MNKAAVILIFILAIAAVFTVLENRRKDPSPRDTFELMRKYVKAGQFDRIWSLYSREFREDLSRQIDEMKVSIKKEIDKGSDWAGKWTFAQVRATPEQFLKLTPQEIDARQMQQNAARALKQRINEVSIAGVTATATVIREEGAPLSQMTFVLRDGKWLIRSSSFMPLK
jgi:hypothetical protein